MEPEDHKCSADKYKRHDDILRRLDSGRIALYQWLVISASIAVLLLTFKQYRAIVVMSSSVGSTNKEIREQNEMIVEQNKILASIFQESIRHNTFSHSKEKNGAK